VFCHYLRVGDLYVKQASPEHPPTQAPGQPDARAPLLLTPFSTINGVAAIAQELCGEATASAAR